MLVGVSYITRIKRGASNVWLDRAVNAMSCEIPISTAYTGPLLLIPFEKVIIIFLHEKIEIFFKRFEST
jgi:hypothetical protein